MEKGRLIHFYNNHYAKNNDNTFVDNPSNCDNNHFHGDGGAARRSESSKASSSCLVVLMCLVLSIVAVAVSSLVIYYHLSKVCLQPSSILVKEKYNLLLKQYKYYFHHTLPFVSNCCSWVCKCLLVRPFLIFTMT